MKILDLTNKKFNKLTAIQRVENKGKKVVWQCICDCGNTINVLTTNLTCGKTQSCGCLKNEKLRKRNTIHNQRHTKLYEIWKSIKQRCLNPNNKNYKRYGGRGIKICNEWLKSFSSFYDWSINNGYNPNLSIDRINNNYDYCPENCRWTDKITQANNTRTNRYITFNNQTKTLAEWSRFFNIKYQTLQARLKKYSVDKVFNSLLKI